MNAIKLKEALCEILREYGKINDKYAVMIKDTIISWYYNTYINAEECIGLMEEYLTQGKLSLEGKFGRK